jgi:hypothetical protein
MLRQEQNPSPYIKVTVMLNFVMKKTLKQLNEEFEITELDRLISQVGIKWSVAHPDLGCGLI